MTFFVKIQRLNGQRDWLTLAENLNSKGFGDRVEYNSGGWTDNRLTLVSPHLKFDNEDDAIAYVLSFGGEILRTIPNYQSTY